MAGKTEYKNHRQKENVDRINLTTQKGKEEIIKAHAESRRESVNGFINRAIDETMERIRPLPGPPARPCGTKAEPRTPRAFGAFAMLIRAACREPEKGRWGK